MTIDVLPPVCCDRCGTRLRNRFDTDGHGTAIEFVEPCPVCIGRQARVVFRPAQPAPKARKRGGPRTGSCGQCGEDFEYRKKGVLPQMCTRCQSEKRLSCPCGRVWFVPRNRGRYRRLCPTCREGG